MATHLPRLPEVERLRAGCIRILGGNPGKFTLQGTNTYLVGTGPARLLIDTGEGRPSWIAALRRVLAEEGKAGGDRGGGETPRIAAALLTHRHMDHIGGVPDLVAAWPDVKVYKRLDPSDRKVEGVGEVPGAGKGRLLDIRDGQIFRVPGATLRAVHTPGHTTDHTVFVWEEDGEDGEDGEADGRSRNGNAGGDGNGNESKEPGKARRVIALFTGDNVLGHGTAVFEDLTTYLASLARMRRLYGGSGGVDGDGAGRQEDARHEAGGAGLVAYPGHGAVVPHGPAKIDEYIRHRAQREEQVVQTLRSPPPTSSSSPSPSSSDSPAKGDEATSPAPDDRGDGPSGWTVMELVGSIYRGVPESLHAAAAGGVVQILRKLQREGKVVVVGADTGAGAGAGAGADRAGAAEERWKLAGSASPGRSAL